MGNRHLEVLDLTFHSSVHVDVSVFPQPLLQAYFILNTKGNGRLRIAERIKLGADTLKALVNSLTLLLTATSSSIVGGSEILSLE